MYRRNDSLYDNAPTGPDDSPFACRCADFRTIPILLVLVVPRRLYLHAGLYIMETAVTHSHASVRHEGLYRFVQMLTPSWLSWLVIILIPIVAMATAIILADIRGTALYEGLTAWQHTTVATQYDYQNIAIWVDNNSFLSNVPLLMLWAVVGAAVYLSVVQLLRAIIVLVRFEEELHFMHANQTEIVWEAILRLSIRLFDASAIYATVFYDVRHLLPQALAAARAVAQYHTWAYIYQASLTTLALMASIWLAVVLARLFFFRTRLFVVY